MPYPANEALGWFEWKPVVPLLRKTSVGRGQKKTWPWHVKCAQSRCCRQRNCPYYNNICFGHHFNAVSVPVIITCCVALLQLKSGTIIQLYQQFAFLLLRKRDTVPLTQLVQTRLPVSSPQLQSEAFLVPPSILRSTKHLWRICACRSPTHNQEPLPLLTEYVWKESIQTSLINSRTQSKDLAGRAEVSDRLPVWRRCVSTTARWWHWLFKAQLVVRPSPPYWIEKVSHT